ncbi:hypothetical protein [Methanosarcina acetivorans]|uniref:hypothetical protein n=1 Tax=Methanosarcina acetivorans TaxID=2214 RepID=UPI00064FED1E|nr:hypothetical protein [Methanosarcina acetivorans]
MIWVWIMVIIGLLSTLLTYFVLTEPIMGFLDIMVSWGAPEWAISTLTRSYHTGFIILGVGIIVYGLLHSTKDEPDTYKF